MGRTADLDSALSFVIGQIAEQAKLSGEPLSDEQRLLLNYLPSSAPGNRHPEIPVLVPRNIDLERVCALAKAAYQHDRQTNPASLDWEFAFAVTALLPIVAVLVVWNADGSLFRPVGIGLGSVAIMFLMFLASRRIKKQQLEGEIERCRLASRFVGTMSR